MAQRPHCFHPTVAAALALMLGGAMLALAVPAAGRQANRKTIKDPAEYNAYVAAVKTTDPVARAAAMEAFAKGYPQSVVFVDALEQAMAAYQQVGNAAKVDETARRILQADPGNIRAIAIVTALDRAVATQGGDQGDRALSEMCSNAQTGLAQLPHWPKPDGTTDADFEKLRTQMAGIFNGALGYCALQKRDYVSARAFYEKSFQIDPTNLEDVYQLAVTDFQMKPMDVNGLWYCAKAVQLARSSGNTQGANGISVYCEKKYKGYHGSADGWDQIETQAAGESSLPAGFAASVKAAPTPCDLAVEAVQQNDPATLSFADRIFILSAANCSPANKGAADKVWQSIQDLQKQGQARLEIPVKVISSTKDTMDVAISDDAQAANYAEMHVVMEKPMRQPAAAGLMTKVIGSITSYTLSPFIFTMEHGELSEPKRPPPRVYPTK